MSRYSERSSKEVFLRNILMTSLGQWLRTQLLSQWSRLHFPFNTKIQSIFTIYPFLLPLSIFTSKPINRFLKLLVSLDNLHTYIPLRLYPRNRAEASQIFIRDAHVLPKLLSYDEYCADVIGGKPIAVWLQPISGVSAVNPLVVFYEIHGGKREVLIFNFIPDTTRDGYR
jgi:hypothetical protein